MSNQIKPSSLRNEPSKQVGPSRDFQNKVLNLLVKNAVDTIKANEVTCKLGCAAAFFSPGSEFVACLKFANKIAFQKDKAPEVQAILCSSGTTVWTNPESTRPGIEPEISRNNIVLAFFYTLEELVSSCRTKDETAAVPQGYHWEEFKRWLDQVCDGAGQKAPEIPESVQGILQAVGYKPSSSLVYKGGKIDTKLSRSRSELESMVEGLFSRIFAVADVGSTPKLIQGTEWLKPSGGAKYFPQHAQNFTQPIESSEHYMWSAINGMMAWCMTFMKGEIKGIANPSANIHALRYLDYLRKQLTSYPYGPIDGPEVRSWAWRTIHILIQWCEAIMHTPLMQLAAASYHIAIARESRGGLEEMKRMILNCAEPMALDWIKNSSDKEGIIAVAYDLEKGYVKDPCKNCREWILKGGKLSGLNASIGGIIVSGLPKKQYAKKHHEFGDPLSFVSTTRELSDHLALRSKKK